MVLYICGGGGGWTVIVTMTLKVTNVICEQPLLKTEHPNKNISVKQSFTVGLDRYTSQPFNHWSIPPWKKGPACNSSSRTRWQNRNYHKTLAGIIFLRCRPWPRPLKSGRSPQIITFFRGARDMSTYKPSLVIIHYRRTFLDQERIALDRYEQGLYILSIVYDSNRSLLKISVSALHGV